ncbi:MAG: PAS domain-containing sensor histidine kinase [Chitinophagales bacterium]|nr:PAS domain-containing sensor histidine kinase [Chitinophagales bacterium]
MEEKKSFQDKMKFEDLFESATIGMIMVNESGEILLMNSFAEQQFGYEKKELTGKKIEALVPMNVKVHHAKLRDSFVQSLQNRPMGIGRDLLALRKDGSTFPVEISLSHYKSENEMYIIAFVNDITIRKLNENSILKQQEILRKFADEVRTLNTELEQRVLERTLVLRETLQQLERSKNELENALSKEKELSDLKSRFVSMASHEFRTPLSSILSSASLIDKYRKEEEQQNRDRHVNRIKENVKNLTDILEDFLSLGKLEEGLIKTTITEFSIAELVNAIIYDMNELRKPSQKIIYMHEGEVKIFSDMQLLKNILFNLLSNAIKFSKDDGSIKVNTFITTKQAMLTVKDSGIGISKEDCKHLFDRFFRGRNAQNIKGSGLGLHIVTKYVELLKGSISYKTKLNYGTEFIIKIPIK